MGIAFEIDPSDIEGMCAMMCDNIIPKSARVITDKECEELEDNEDTKESNANCDTDTHMEDML